MGMIAAKLRIPTPEQALPGRKERMPVADLHYVTGAPMRPPFAGMEMAMFGLGCFWGAERKFWEIVPRLALREYDGAEPLIRAQLAGVAGDARATAIWTRLLGGLAMARGRFAEADRLFRDEEDLWRRLGSRTSAIEAAARRIAMTGRLRGDPLAAARILDETMRRYPAIAPKKSSAKH